MKVARNSTAPQAHRPPHRPLRAKQRARPRHASCRSAKFEPQVCVILGLQWGDEGKGKIVDVLSKQYDLVARAQGGSNAGHTIYDDAGTKYKLHLVPSGILAERALCIIGNGVVVSLPGLLDEIRSLEEKGIHDVKERLVISDRAHILLDMHMKVDGLREAELSGKGIGTTKRGIGPAYASKALRNGLRICDLRDADIFEEKLRRIVDDAVARWGDDLTVNYTLEVTKYADIAKTILPMMRDTVELVNDAVEDGKRVLVEGANATMLDVDFGTYPFVTSSNPSIGGVCAGLGLAPRHFGAVIGVAKAYCTRVGSGPFPTEVFGQLAEDLRERGAEYGTTTGRPRRVGWLDLVALRYACRINGTTHLNLTKLDVLSDLDEVPLGVAYKVQGLHQKKASVPADWNTLQARLWLRLLPSCGALACDTRPHAWASWHLHNQCMHVGWLAGSCAACTGFACTRVPWCDCCRLHMPHTVLPRRLSCKTTAAYDTQLRCRSWRSSLRACQAGSKTLAACARLKSCQSRRSDSAPAWKSSWACT